MAIRCMIVDDEPLAVQLLESFVQRTDGLELVASYNDPSSALDALDRLEVDLLFLDIQMPGLDGLQLARQVPQQTRIVFTTAFKEYAFDSYEVSAVDYLLKPIRYQKFLSAVDKVRHASQPVVPATPDSLFLRVDGEIRRINVADITYVEGMKDYIRIKLDGQRVPLTTHLTMQAIEAQLGADRFMRVSRSYIVALDRIRAVDRNHCLYVDDQVIRVTDSYLKTFQAYLAKNMPS